MAQRFSLPVGVWTQVRPVAFESGIFQTEQEQVIIEFAPTAPPAGSKDYGVVMKHLTEWTNPATDATNAAWATPAGGNDATLRVLG